MILSRNESPSSGSGGIALVSSAVPFQVLRPSTSGVVSLTSETALPVLAAIMPTVWV